ncbi:MAG: hypothetical protein WC379_18470 [Methanoregula sp.]|jgi:hypothetical protein
MTRELDIHEVFVEFLVSKGYPRNSVTIDPVYEHLGRKYRPDIVIVEPDTNKPLAIFEIKNELGKNGLNSAIQQLFSYAQAIKIPDIPLFAAFPTIVDKEITFEIYQIKSPSETKETESSGKIESPPSYALLKNSRLTEELSKISEDQEKTVDNFTKVCWGLAFLVFLFLIIDFLNIYKIDLQRLGLIGVLIGLIILPFANKLKILGFEFERLTQSKKGNDEKEK